MDTRTAALGDLMSTFFEEFMAIYNDADLASVATAALINDLLAREVVVPAAEQAA